MKRPGHLRCRCERSVGAVLDAYDCMETDTQHPQDGWAYLTFQRASLISSALHFQVHDVRR